MYLSFASWRNGVGPFHNVTSGKRWKIVKISGQIHGRIAPLIIHNLIHCITYNFQCKNNYGFNSRKFVLFKYLCGA